MGFPASKPGEFRRGDCRAVVVGYVQLRVRCWCVKQGRGGRADGWKAGFLRARPVIHRAVGVVVPSLHPGVSFPRDGGWYRGQWVMTGVLLLFPGVTRATGDIRLSLIDQGWAVESGSLRRGALGRVDKTSRVRIHGSAVAVTCRPCAVTPGRPVFRRPTSRTPRERSCSTFDERRKPVRRSQRSHRRHLRFPRGTRVQSDRSLPSQPDAQRLSARGRCCRVGQYCRTRPSPVQRLRADARRR